MDVLYAELEVLYGALSQGETPELPALALQYADYAIWQRQWAESRALEKQLTWWKEQLAGVPPILELPTDRPRPPIQDFRGALVPFQIDRETTAALRTLAAQEHVTPTMVLLAGFQALLHRYTGQEEFLVGMPHANRERSELAGVVGFFVNTLAMRADLSGEPSFRALLARVRETSLGAHEHSRLPFERLVKALRPERDLSTLPLVQVMFAPQVSKLGRLKLPGLGVEPLAVDPGRATFDLTLCSWEETDTIGGQWEYSTALFERSTLERMAGHLIRLLREPSVSRTRGSRACRSWEMKSGSNCWSGGMTPPLPTPASPRFLRPSPSRSSGLRRPWPCGSARSSSPTGSWTCGPTRSPGDCAAWAWARTHAWRSPWGAPWSSSSPWWEFSRRAAPTCLSTPTILASGWPSCSRPRSPTPSSPPRPCCRRSPRAGCVTSSSWTTPGSRRNPPPPRTRE